MKTIVKNAFVLVVLIASTAAAQQLRVRPVQRPQIPPIPMGNPQAAPNPYAVPAPAYQVPGPAPYQVPFQTPAQAPQQPAQVPQQQVSNRCFVSQTSFGVLNQYAPLGAACWVSDANGNVYNGVIN